MNLLRASATELARSIAAGEQSSRDVLEAHLTHLMAVNPELNAVVADRFDAAREEADAADAAVARGEPLAPLHGVPCTIKECFALTGMPQCAGLASRADYRAPADAPTVARIRGAGAIPMGVTNLSELCMWMESNNTVYGRTNNPYDPRRTVGGSSGGEGAIIASGASPFGLGSDIGGSIRLPSFFNGIFGHKPSPGTVPNTGQWPNAEGETHRFLGTGPMCRRAEDLFPLLELLAGPDGEDPLTEQRTLIDPASVSLVGMPVAVVGGRGAMSPTAEVVDAQQRAAAALAAAGAEVRQVDMPAFSGALEIWASMLGDIQPASGFRTQLGHSGPATLWLELLRMAVGRSAHTFPAVVLGLIENLSLWTPKRTARAVEAGHALRAELRETIGEGIMLYPTYPTVAPRHHGAKLPPINYAYTCLFNAMAVPVTQVPTGLGTSGMPTGVQVIGSDEADHRTLAVALELERALGGWVFPPRLEPLLAG